MLDMSMTWWEICQSLRVRQDSLARTFARWRAAGLTDIKVPYPRRTAA
jgi:hypothetical protein